MKEYRFYVKFPKTRLNFEDNNLIFYIGNMRSRKPSIVYFNFYCWNDDGELIYYDDGVKTDGIAYSSPRWIVGNLKDNKGKSLYQSYQRKFQLNQKLLDETVVYQIELVTLGIDSENPLYFNRLMLEEGTVFSGYHEPSELIKNAKIDFLNNPYVNLYSQNGNYMQVIRPSKESLHTTKLDGASMTILAPHFAEEDEIDNHVSVYYEAMYQRRQRIDLLR